MPTIIKPDDFHAHFRQGEMLATMVNHSAVHFGRALAMPNTIPPLLTGEDVMGYQAQCQAANRRLSIVPTMKITDSTTPEMIRAASAMGVVAGKLYLVGTTTNSDDGITDITGRHAWELFAAMEEVDMVLCLHGEVPWGCSLDRESKFLMFIKFITTDIKHLRIVLEHASTAAAVNFIRWELPDRVAATITAHHLMLTIDDVLGQPHHFCKPVPKREEDRRMLIEAATSGDPRFFFGSDSAPHTKENKECASACAGVFTAPVAMSVLAQVFEDMDRLDNLERFTSVNGAAFYGLGQNSGTLTLTKDPWIVPEEYDGVVPFMAGKELQWRVSRVSRR